MRELVGQWAISKYSRCCQEKGEAEFHKTLFVKLNWLGAGRSCSSSPGARLQQRPSVHSSVPDCEDAPKGLPLRPAGGQASFISERRGRDGGEH